MLYVTLPLVLAENLTELQILHDHLSRDDLPTFLAMIKAENRSAPNIFSRWHIEKHLLDPEQKQFSIEARSCGKLLAEKLTVASTGLAAISEPAELEHRCRTLLSLAAWLTDSPSYGNCLLAARCHDIAATAIARLVADLTYPIEKVRALIRDLDAAFYSTDYRIRVLNEEAGDRIFQLRHDDPSTRQTLEATWAAGSMLLLAKKNPTTIDASKSQAVKRYEGDLQILTKNLEFFDDDPLTTVSPPYTLISSWDRKWHEIFVTGLDSDAARKARALFSFRENVGTFPTTVPYTNHPFRSDGEAAFERAWRPYANGDHASRTLYSTAWQAYDEITRKVFVDSDRRSMLIYEKTTPP